MADISSVAQLMARAALKRDTVELDDDVLHVRELSVGQRATFYEAVKEKATDAPVLLVRMGAIKPDGAPLLSADEAQILLEAAPAVVDAIADKVMKLSGLGDDEKKADATQTGNSSSS